MSENQKVEPRMIHQAAFEAAMGKGFDFSLTKDAWGRDVYLQPHIFTAYHGFELGLKYQQPQPLEQVMRSPAIDHGQHPYTVKEDLTAFTIVGGDATPAEMPTLSTKDVTALKVELFAAKEANTALAEELAFAKQKLEDIPALTRYHFRPIGEFTEVDGFKVKDIYTILDRKPK